MTVIQFTRFQADSCRLWNRRFEIEAQRLSLEPTISASAETPPIREFPTPFGWFLIGLAMISGGRR
jgi:hypothetical protein